MSKAEQRALEAYPIKIAQREGYDENLRERKGFIKGYQQAEKDLELSWKDLATIEKLGDDFIKQNQTPMSDEEFYKEVLRRFKDLKK